MEVQWSLVVFTTLAGAGAWLYVAFCAASLKGDVQHDRTRAVSCILTVVLLLAGTLASVTHLSHPDRIMAVLAHPTMGIFTEALFVGLTTLAVGAYALAWRRGAPYAAQKVLLGIGAVLAATLALMLGYSYMMPARPVWDTVLLPIAYMLTSMSGGAAAYLVAASVGGEDAPSISFGAKLLVGAGVLAAVSAVAYGAVAGILTEGTAVLWLAILICAALVPVVLGAVASRNPSQALGLGAAALLFGLVGCGAFRMLMWTVGEGVRNYFGMII